MIDQRFCDLLKHAIIIICIKFLYPRPSRFQIPGGPKMARDTLCRRTIDGPYAVELSRFCVVHIKFYCRTCNCNGIGSLLW